MNSNVSDLVQAAGKSAAAGNWQQAEEHWRQVIALEPTHPQALCSLGIHALQRGDVDTALGFLETSRAAAPGDTLTLMTIAAAHRHAGNAAGEREAIDAVLETNSNFVPALLLKADWMERNATAAAAAATYKAALAISPAEADWPPDFRERLLHARAYVARHSEALLQHLNASLASELQRLPSGLAPRWREAVSIRAGMSRPFVSQSNQLHIPRLPAIPFYDRSAFPFLAALEAGTDTIRAELADVIANHSDGFVPYIAYNRGDPVNQWKKLNHSRDWGAFHLWRGGVACEDNLKHCPETARILRTLPLADIDGLCPNVFFSSLQPHTHIPPHYGESNARLIAHLPLLVPAGCKLRVGFEEREWKVGEVLVFDDTLQHEAVNNSDDLRVVLIFDLWNPLLSEAERKLTSRLAAATRQFSGRSPTQNG
ncbi:MAG TPA: aspartyl/asparaginyl beta-hydroxylase domain-containing protein [Woeseiaceae bacterium]|nr:aspartyl/asparaginyl beta-hydroxylase domain-containing protein [Woeseiaceae bacterium]